MLSWSEHFQLDREQRQATWKQKQLQTTQKNGDGEKLEFLLNAVQETEHDREVLIISSSVSQFSSEIT